MGQKLFMVKYNEKDEVKKMKKVLIFLLVVGVLMGTFVITEEMSEASLELVEFSEGENLESSGEPGPCGGGDGGGQGGIPG